MHAPSNTQNTLEHTKHTDAHTKMKRRRQKNANTRDWRCILYYYLHDILHQINFYKSDRIKLFAYSNHHKDVVKAQPLTKKKDKFSPQIIPLIIQAHDKKENSDHQQKHTYFVNKNIKYYSYQIFFSSSLHYTVHSIYYIILQTKEEVETSDFWLAVPG